MDNPKKNKIKSNLGNILLLGSGVVFSAGAFFFAYSLFSAILTATVMNVTLPFVLAAVTLGGFFSIGLAAFALAAGASFFLGIERFRNKHDMLLINQQEKTKSHFMRNYFAGLGLLALGALAPSALLFCICKGIALMTGFFATSTMLSAIVMSVITVGVLAGITLGLGLVTYNACSSAWRQFSKSHTSTLHQEHVLSKKTTKEETVPNAPTYNDNLNTEKTISYRLFHQNKTARQEQSSSEIHQESERRFFVSA